MPITKSAKKALRKSEKRRIKNLKRKEEIRSLLKEAKRLVLEKKIDEAKKLLPKIYKVLDKAAKVGILKKNAVDRKKSKIAKLILKSGR
jgi:small subunit ribosomal protein S20